VQIAVLVFALVLVIVFGVYWMFILRPEEQEDRALRKRLTVRRARALTTTLLRARQRMSSVGAIEKLLTQWSGALEPLHRLIERSAVRTNTGTVVMASLFLIVVGMVLAALTRLGPGAYVVGALAGAIPTLYLRRAARKRLATFEAQFPEAVDFMARALRAGHTLPTALQLVGSEIPDPIGAEFGLLADQQNYGMSMPDALKAFAERVPLLDARFFVTAVLTQREMGGNLSEVLDNLASVIRERFKVKRQVRAVSAHGRITATVLGFLPPAVAAILFIIAPAHMLVLIQDSIGRALVGGGLVLQFVGVIWIRKVVEVEY
jgi:tight adherence protein B